MNKIVADFGHAFHFAFADRNKRCNFWIGIAVSNNVSPNGYIICPLVEPMIFLAAAWSTFKRRATV